MNEDPLIGRTLGGRYRIEAALGRGGMGAVYRATHVGLNRSVAIKVLKPELQGDQDHLTRFFREAQAAAGLTHPNVIDVLDIHRGGDDPPYLVMEYVQGESLGQAIRRDGPLAQARVIEIGRQMLSALEAAHRAGVVHRDLKPANVMLTDDHEGQESVRLVDFGIAKLMDAKAVSRLTATGQVLGTPRYMAPEQSMGEHSDGRTDVYAAGLVLYQALTGRLPFSGLNGGHLIHAILQGELAPLPVLRPDIDPDLARVIHRAIAVAPAQRFDSAEAFEAALAALAPEARHSGEPSNAPEIPATAIPSRRFPLWIPFFFIPLFVTAAATLAWVSLRGEPPPAGTMPSGEADLEIEAVIPVRGALDDSPAADAGELAANADAALVTEPDAPLAEETRRRTRPSSNESSDMTRSCSNRCLAEVATCQRSRPTTECMANANLCRARCRDPNSGETRATCHAACHQRRASCNAQENPTACQREHITCIRDCSR